MKYVYIISFIIASIYQGLYFYEQHIIANIIIVVYAMKLYRSHIAGNRTDIYMNKREKGWIIPALSLIMLTSIYIISIFYGINREGAIIEGFRMIGFLPAFYIGLNITEEKREWIEQGIIYSGIVVAVIGFISLSGLVNIDGALYGQRMQSTFQYANVTALYLMIGIILCGKGTFCLPHFSLLFIGILTCGLMLTYSRGVWIIFAIVNVFLILSKEMLMQKHTKIRYVYTLLIFAHHCNKFIVKFSYTTSKYQFFCDRMAGKTGLL